MLFYVVTRYIWLLFYMYVVVVDLVTPLLLFLPFYLRVVTFARCCFAYTFVVTICVAVVRCDYVVVPVVVVVTDLLLLHCTFDYVVR